MWRRLWRECLDLLAPPRCDVCGKLGADALCPVCAQGFDLIKPPYCQRCGRAFDPTAQGAPECAECRAGAPRFDLARAVGRHTGTLRQAVLSYKFRGAQRLARPLAARLAGLLQELDARGELALSDVEALVPVPLHEARRRWRGFDQAQLLAEHVGSQLGLRVLTGTLIRCRETTPQVELKPNERAQNVRGAFETAKPGLVAGRKLMLVDDVFTTGATINECARMLRQAGAARACALTVTRSSPDWDAGRDLY
jgi:ComF family protein